MVDPVVRAIVIDIITIMYVNLLLSAPHRHELWMRAE